MTGCVGWPPEAIGDVVRDDDDDMPSPKRLAEISFTRQEIDTPCVTCTFTYIHEIRT